MEEKVVTPKTNPTPPVSAPDPVIPTVEETSKVEQLEHLTDAKTDTKEDNQSKVDTLIPSDPYYMDPLFYQVATYFDISQAEWDGAKNQLSDIVDYVIREIQVNRPEEVLNYIRKIERSLEKPHWDERRYKHVHSYIKLGLSKQAISKAMKAFEKEAIDGN